MKTLLLFLFSILFSLQVFSQATSGTRITSPIVPNDSSDVYPTHDAAFGRDGYRSVLTITERNAIKTGLRKEGMQVYVKADSTIYQLRHGITNSNWFIVNNTLLPSITAFVNDNFGNGGVVIVVTIDVDTFNFQGHSLSYNWRGPGGFSSTDKSNMTITPGLYNVIVTDNNTKKNYQSSVYVIEAIQWTTLGQPMQYLQNIGTIHATSTSIMDKNYIDSIASGGALYKTVYVDSAKVWNQFDTLIISSPGINNTIVLDEIRYRPISGSRMFDLMACFMTYYDTITGQVAKDLPSSQFLANGNGVSHTLGSGNLGNTKIIPGSLIVTTDAQTLTDNGDNTLSGDGTGTINYNTGAITLNWTSAPILGHPINADSYSWLIDRVLRTSFSEIGNFFNFGNGSLFSTPKLVRPLMSESVAILNGSWLLTWNNVANDYFTTSLFLNKGVKFHVGDFINSSTGGFTHNTIGNLKLKFIIKYHIETIQ